MQRRPVLAAVLVSVAALLLLAGCGDDTTASDDGSAASAPTSTPSTTTSVAAETSTTTESPSSTTTESTTVSEFPRTVDDAFGSVEIATAPERVVVLDQSLLDASLTLGLEVIGYTTYADPEGPIPALYAEAAAIHATDATWVGDLLAPNLEQIAALRPDMILTSAVRHEAIADQLRAIAPTVMTESAGAGWKDTLDLVSRAVGREDAAAEALAGYVARATAVGDEIRETHGDPTVSVVRFVDEIRLYQPASFSGVVLADVGLARPESQQDTEDFIRVISQEELALADADVLVYTAYDHPDVTAALDDILAGPLWRTLGAVERGDVHEMADARWMSGVGLFGAHAILDDLTEIFSIDEQGA